MLEMFLNILIPLTLLHIFVSWTHIKKACALILSVGHILQRAENVMYRIFVNPSVIIISVKTLHTPACLIFR